MNLENILLRDTRANQPAATDVAEGSLFCVTDEDDILEQSRASAWVSYSPAAGGGGIDQLTGDVTAGPGSGSQAATVKAAIRTTTIGITVDGGGSPITAGAKGFRSFPVAGTITKVRLIADAAGDVVFDILKSTYAAFPTQSSIVAAAPPTLSGVQKNEDSTLSGWTTSVVAGDVFGFEVEGSPTPSVDRVTLELTIVIS